MHPLLPFGSLPSDIEHMKGELSKLEEGFGNAGRP
jgi:hypothetical protein